MPIIVLAVLFVLVVIALIPVSIVQRFRMGTARRPARRWVATLNLSAVIFSALLFILGALITSRWVPQTLPYTFAGLGGGAILGLLGVALTRWEYLDGRLRYVPNRWLVLTITVVVAARVFYGFWRSWDMWRGSEDGMAWIAASGLAASMSAGAVVIGYYIVFWTGIRWRIGRAG